MLLLSRRVILLLPVVLIVGWKVIIASYTVIILAFIASYPVVIILEYDAIIASYTVIILACDAIFASYTAFICSFTLINIIKKVNLGEVNKSNIKRGGCPMAWLVAQSSFSPEVLSSNPG